MKTSKILININKLNEIDEYKKIGYFNFLFAVKEFSIGYSSFSLDEIPTDAYLFINRVMDTKAIKELRQVKDKIAKYKGIIFEDIGVFNIFKDTSLELIWFQNHFTTNYDSINFWLEKGCNSAIISNEITKEEILEISNKAIKPLVLNVFGKNQIMYSRRTLLTNFNTYQKLDEYQEMILDEVHTHNTFLAKECDYGTVIFNNEYFNYISLTNEIDENSIKFYLILNLDYNPNEIMNIINGASVGNDGFLNKKTVYKMAEYNDR